MGCDLLDKPEQVPQLPLDADLFLFSIFFFFFCQYFHLAPCPLLIKLRQCRIPHFTLIRSDSATYNVLIWILKDIVYFLNLEELNVSSCSLSIFAMLWKLGWAFCPDTASDICFMKIEDKMCGGWIMAWTWALVWLNMCKKSLRITEITN